jgi:SRSO17 transposase
MPVPIICLDSYVRHFVEQFREQFSKPQFKYFVTVLLGLLLCQEARTLSGLLRQVAQGPGLWGLSRFLSTAPWEPGAVVASWLARFREQMQPKVALEQERQVRERPRQRGRPKKPVVTGYLIGDDSTIHKRKGKKMEGLGQHHSSTEGKRVRGHSLVQGLYVLLGRSCPLAPQLYRQQRVCEKEGVPFASKIALMIECIRTFEPVAGTLTHVLLDSWYSAKAIWRAARERGFLITTGLKSNRSIRVEDPATPEGWRWQKLADYTAELAAGAYVLLTWPTQTTARQVYVHVVSTRVKKLYRSQVVIVRESLQAPLWEARYFASSDLEADIDTLLQHITARWDIEVLFGDVKELLGLDQYQLMTASAILRFWTLVMVAYTFLDEERERLRQQTQCAVTIGDARREVQHRHRRHLLHWLHEQFQAGITPEALCDQLAA